jgi:hypothetical protein
MRKQYLLGGLVVALALPVVAATTLWAEDGKDRPEAKAVGDKPAGDRAGEKREGDRGDRDRGPRDGDRPEGRRLAGERPPGRPDFRGPREGDRPPPPRGARPFGPPREGDRMMPPNLGELFKKLDKNEDGVLSKEEFMALPRPPMPPPRGLRFDGERRPLPPREGDRPRPTGDRPRGDGDRRPEGDRRPDGDRRPEREQDRVER